MATNVTIGYTNLGQQTIINGRNWAKRLVLAKRKFDLSIRASVYLLSECDSDMAAMIAVAMKWGSKSQPCWRTDENRNTVIWDAKKWRDVDTSNISLSEKSGDLGDKHYRSVNWVLLENRKSGDRCWFGASHLDNNGSYASVAPAAREMQAKIIATNLPIGAPRVLGIDRNSLDGAEPDKQLRKGLPILSAGSADSFRGNGFQSNVGAIDALYGDVTLRSLKQVDMGGATDHAAFRASITIPAN